MSRTSEKPTVNRITGDNPHYFKSHPPGILYETLSRNNITLWGAMEISTYNG